MQTAKGGVTTMVLLAALLAGFGLWQFGGGGLSGEGNDGHEHEEHEGHPSGERDAGAGSSAAAVSGILARYGGRVYEMEREYEQGREILEIKLIDRDGRRREFRVNSDGRQLEEERE